ncbi:MAG TPA: hypothetical protein PK197_03755 [Candidatus Cloacimonas sp.]|nr:hypothetical protein [Candidatus Cloacimonas sp.]
MKKIILTLLILFLIPLTTKGATFGYTSVGATEVDPTVNGSSHHYYLSNQNSTVSSNGTISSVSFYGYGNFSNACGLGVYKNNSGTYNLIDNGSFFNCGASAQWNTDNTISASVVSGGIYLATFAINDAGKYFRDSGKSGDGRIASNIKDSSAWSDPMSTSNYSYKVSVYATYDSPLSYSRNSTTTINNGRIQINNGRLNIK